MIVESWDAENSDLSLGTRINQSQKKMAEWKRRNRINASIRIATFNDAYTYGNRSTEEIHEITLT